MAIDYQKLREKFREIYGGKARIFRAPGRVNLIGEHTDYNGGFVLPMAIERECAVAIAAGGEKRKIRVQSLNLNEAAEFNLDRESERKQGFWLNYIEGMARLLERNKIFLSGADLLIWSDVPTGAGLSSSAALETAVGVALTGVSGNTVDRKTLALIGQATEHEFVGAKVGIMDQFVSAHAQAGHALLLDCRTLESQNVPVDASRYAVVMFDTNVKHNLAASEYNTRRAECERGVEILKKFLPEISQLRDVTTSDFEKYERELPEIIKQRCRHVIGENERTLRAADALKKNDLVDFGRLMRLSHESLRDDYEVSCRELDLLCELAGKYAEILGARMTGGGFGGSTVNLIERESLPKIAAEICADYEKAMGIEATVLISNAANGASEVLEV